MVKRADVVLCRDMTNEVLWHDAQQGFGLFARQRAQC